MTEIPVSGSDRALVFAPSSTVEEIVKDINACAPTEDNVLILGPNGTGKETIAKLIHQGSSRKDHEFTAINCAGITESLLESELFGHEKGAFTGAVQQKKGFFERANGGTLFLDEIGEMSPGLQARLLRVLEEKKIYRVGGTEEIKVTPRIIAATNIDVAEAIRTGKLREDLYYRLNQTEIDVPPLQNRKIDIPLLVDHFISKFAREKGFQKPELAEESLDVLMANAWPGNVRQLQNIVRGAVNRAHSANNVITPDMLKWPKGAAAQAEPQRTAFVQDATTDIGAILTKNGRISMLEVSNDSGVSRATLRKHTALDNNLDAPMEKLMLYMYKREGEAGAARLFNALLKRLIEQDNEKNTPPEKS